MWPRTGAVPPYAAATVALRALIAPGGDETVGQHAGHVPRHQASAHAWWTHALARPQPYLALGAVAGAAALASAVLLILPSHASPPAAARCGLVTCTTWRHAVAAQTPQPRLSPPSARPRSISHAVARPRSAPAQPAVPARATPLPTPSSRPLAHHHGRGKALGHQRPRHRAAMGR
jgi:hypothetical protein